MGANGVPETVAAILVNYESGEDLSAALWSLIRLDRTPDILIVVDNASRDDSLHQAEQQISSLIVIRNNENVGFAKAVNQGFRKACDHGATHIWLFNPDARAHPETLSRLLDMSRCEPKALFSPMIFDAIGRVWFSGGRLRWWRMRALHKQRLEFYGENQDFLTGCALFIPKTALDVVGEFDERFFLYYEDVDYSVRAKKAGFQLRVVPDAVVDHAEVSRWHPQKTYFLVYSGLLFFFKHSHGPQEWYFRMYVTIRRLKNWFDCLLFGGKEAMSVRRAYGDFFQNMR